MIKASLSAIIVFLSLLSAPVPASDIADIILDSKLDSMKQANVGRVTYPHKLHEQWYKCGDCHPKIFIDKHGANDINMQKNMTEQYCGYSGCHNSAYAFPLYLCDNCHAVLEKPASNK